MGKSSPMCDACLQSMFQPWSGSGVLGVKQTRESTTLQTCYLSCTNSHHSHQFLGRVKLSSVSCSRWRNGKGWGRPRGFTDAIIACKGNTNKGLGSRSLSGSLQNALLTLQKQHGCKKSADQYGAQKDSGWWQLGNVAFWTDGQTSAGEGHFSQSQLLL